MTEQKIHLIGRIDQIVQDYFKNSADPEIMAKDMMPILIEKGIFKKDHRNGLPIRNLLRELDAENKLHLLKHVKVIRNEVNRNWYFTPK